MRPPMLLGESTSLNKERDGQCSEAHDLCVGIDARAEIPPGSQNQVSAR
jgi:hypothetical protein